MLDKTFRKYFGLFGNFTIGNLSPFFYFVEIFSTQVQSNRLIEQLCDSLMEPDKEYLEFQNFFIKYLKITKNIQISITK